MNEDKLMINVLGYRDGSREAVLGQFKVSELAEKYGVELSAPETDDIAAKIEEARRQMDPEKILEVMADIASGLIGKKSSPSEKIVDLAVAYLEDNGWHEADGEHYVFSRESLDVAKVGDTWVVSGTGTFG